VVEESKAEARQTNSVMPSIVITDFSRQGWADSAVGAQRARWYCEQLEHATILRLRPPLFDLSEDDRRFLCGVQQTSSVAIKNISYRPVTRRLDGYAGSNADAQRLKRLLAGYADSMRKAAVELLSPYAGGLQVDLTSFRPMEERGRRLETRARNDLIHIDSFAHRPARDRRILRFFTNIHPSEPRVWKTSGTFELLADRMARAAGLERYAGRANRLTPRLGRALVAALAAIGFSTARHTPYDRFMLGFHDYLKMNDSFQANCPKELIEFPPGSTWIAFTDAVPHAVVSGQNALEQTFFVPIASLLLPHKSPLRVLEAMSGSRLA